MSKYYAALFLLCFQVNATTLITIRHGQSSSNTKNINSANPGLSVQYPLTELGVKQVEEAAASFKATHKDLIDKIRFVYTSPVYRARQTAELFMKGIGLSPDKLVVDYTIMETTYGDNEGKNADHVANQDPVFAKAHFAETRTDINERIAAFVQRIKTVHKDDTILAVTHGTPMTEILNMASDDKTQNTMPKNAEFRVLELARR